MQSPPNGSHPDDQGVPPRRAAVAMLKRAASTREAASGAPSGPPSASSSRAVSPALSRSQSSATRSRNRSRTISSANPAYVDEDTSLFLSPSADSASPLERQASLLARQLAMAKLTGTAPPTPPPTFFVPDQALPTLAELQERARAKLAREGGPGGAALHRNNTVATTAGVAASAASLATAAGLKRNRTVTGAESGGPSGGVEEPAHAPPGYDEDQPLQVGRAEARVNLMRKLSVRRFEAPLPSEQRDRLGVVGRIGKARPRSGSISALDWRTYEPAGSAAGDAPSSAQPAPSRTLPPPVPQHLGTGVGMGIMLPHQHQHQHPHGNGDERSETPLLMRSSGSWAAERDRQSVLARAQGEGAWEFDDAARGGEGRYGGEETDGEAEVIRDSQLPPPSSSADEPTPRAHAGEDEDRFRTPQLQWASTPSTIHTSTLSPGDSHNGASGDWHPSAPHLGLVVTAPRPSDGSISSSSSASSSPVPSPSTLHDTPRRAPFLPSFGIAAVEEPVRKRGSSASSSIAGQLLDMRRLRGSDAQQGGALNSWQRHSIVSSASTTPEEGEEDEDDQAEELRSSVDGHDGRSGDEVERELLAPREQRLADKVEKKREAAQARAMSPDADKGAFPPPSQGYQFPSPREADAGGSWPDQDRHEDPQQLFHQLTSAAPPVPTLVTPASPGRKGRDFPFNLPFQSLTTNGMFPTSPILPDPISPTSVVPDPMASISIPHTSPRIVTSPKPRFSPVATRNGGVGMERSESQRSQRSQAMVKSPSTESQASFRSAGASSYHSPVAMRRDLSSSSGSSDFTFSPRVPQLPAEQLPSSRILAKLDSIIGPEAVNSTAPNPLDSPPRQLLLQAPVLQVVNANTVKDRHLFLFSDLLVIAKPLIEEHPLTGEPLPPALDNRFLVKSIVEFKHLKLAAAEEPADEHGSSSSSSKKRHPLLVAFVDRFANDPSRAIASLVQKGGLANDGSTIANLLFRNTDLNRNQLGAYLADPNHRHVLRAYIERFRFQGVRVDDALRLFCMTVRLPHAPQQAEYVLGVLASIWTESNGATGFDPSLTLSLIVAILKLSDAMHASKDPAGELATFFGRTDAPPPSVDDFIGAFREHDTRLVVPEDLLTRIYTSVRRERIEQASDNSIFSMTPDIEATIEPAKLPTRLTYRSPSDVFTITIPEPDPNFTIKLHGTDLQFDPPVLSFARSNTQSFRVTGNALGVRVMVLIKRGANAPRYQGLPLNKAFSVERAFMQHTFQVSFTNHLDLKRKYMFSTYEGSSRALWLRLLRERILAALHQPAPASRALAAAQAVSVQVLRDVFLPPEEPLQHVPSAAPSPRPNLAAPRFGPPVTPAPPRTAGTRLGTPTRPGGQLMRSNSVSKLYAAYFKQENDLGGSALDRRSNSVVPGVGGGLGGKGLPGTGIGKDEQAMLQAHEGYIKTGRELVVTAEQNSLLPMVAPHPVSLQGSAFQLPPLPTASGAPAHPAVAFSSLLAPGSAL
ncbi:hypothetical protein JCM10207_008081 [Rhodosporidiobolus poonsookiae]